MGGDWIENMNIDLRGWSFSSKKLPSEEELSAFFSGISTSPVARDTGMFASVLQFDYNNLSGGYRSSSYPVLNGANQSWIVPSLRELSPGTVLSSTAHNLIQSKEYKENLNTPTTEMIRTLPALGFSLEADVVERIRNAAETACFNYSATIKNFKDLHSLKYRIESFITLLISHETNTFKKGLIEGGYIQTNSHLDILEKIKRIREAIPTDPIYIVGEIPLLDYLTVHSISPGQFQKNVWLVQDNYSTYSSGPNTFANYKSAVFATNQMRGGHEFELHYKLERSNRQWQTYTSIIGKLAMDIPPDPLQDKDGKLTPISNSSSRWELF